MKHSAIPTDFSGTLLRHLESYLDEFGYRAPEFLRFRIEQFVLTLADWGAKTNLTANPHDPAQIAFHCADSLAPVLLASSASALQDAFAENREALDLGSGAGFPGLILAAVSPARFVLLESRRKRTSFLQVAAAAMGLANIRVITNISEAKGGGFDTVTARAFGTPEIVLDAARRTLKPDGRAILYANPSQRAALQILEFSGLSRPELIEYRLRREGATVERLLALWYCLPR